MNHDLLFNIEGTSHGISLCYFDWCLEAGAVIVPLTSLLYSPAIFPTYSPTLFHSCFRRPPSLIEQMLSSTSLTSAYLHLQSYTIQFNLPIRTITLGEEETARRQRAHRDPFIFMRHGLWGRGWGGGGGGGWGGGDCAEEKAIQHHFDFLLV